MVIENLAEVTHYPKAIFPRVSVSEETVIIPNHVEVTHITIEELIERVPHEDQPQVREALSIDPENDGPYEVGAHGEGLLPSLLVASLLGRASLELRDELDEQKVAPTVEDAIQKGELRRLHTEWKDPNVVTSLSSHEDFDVMLEHCLEIQDRNPRILGLIGKSGHGKDSFAAALKQSGIFGEVYEVSLGGYFRMLSRAVIYQAYRDGLLTVKDGKLDTDQVQALLLSPERIQELVARIETSERAIQPKKSDETKSAVAEYSPDTQDEDEISVKLHEDIWNQTAGFMDRAVPIIAEASQARGISYAQRAVALLNEELPSDATILIQGRQYTLQCIAQFNSIIKIDNIYPWQVGFRRFQDKVKAAVLRDLAIERYPHLDMKEAKKLISDEDIAKAVTEEHIYAAYVSLYNDVKTLKAALNAA